MPLRIAQTIYAKPAIGGHQPGFPPAFPFLSPDAQPLWVTDVSGQNVIAVSGSINSLIIDLTTALPLETIAYARVAMLEAGGVDPWPTVRLLGVPAIQGAAKQVKQNLVDLIPGGDYVAFASIRTPAGRDYRFVAPFVADGDFGNFLLWDIPGYPPFIMTDDDGVPITADY